MMKSFFKKLSLVMALAMVVSLVAPAGSAFAAEAGIALQGTKTVVDAIDVEVGGDVVDLCFLGAPADWKSTFKWTPGDETIASVDKAGKVTGLKAGETTVTITAGADGSYKHTVKVTVTEPVVELAYDFKQTTPQEFKLTFNQAVDFDKDDVALYCIFDSVDGPVETAWPVKTATLDDAKTVLTVVPYVEFTDGYEYVVKVNGEEDGYSFVASVGQVVLIELSHKSMEKTNQAFTNGEDGELIDVYVNAKLYDAKGVDVTNYSNYKENLTFNLGGEYENVDIDNTTGTMNFYKAGAATVVATYTYVDEEGNEQTIDSKPWPVVCVNAPAYEIVKVDKWTIAKTSTAAKDIAWNDHDVAAYDGNNQIIISIADNYGNTFVNHKGLADLKTDDKVFWTEDTDQMFAKNGYSIQFSSTNNDEILVDVLGGLETYKQTTAYTLVSLHNSELEGDTDFVKNLTALPVKVTAERALSSVSVDKSSITLVTDANVDKLCEGKIEVTVKDQYKGDAKDLGYNFEITTTDKEVKASGLALSVYENDGKLYIDLNGKELRAANGDKAATISFKVTETGSKKSASFSVVLKDPKYVKDNEGNPTTEILLDGWKLEASTEVDQKIESLEKNASATVAADVTLYKTSGSTSVKVDIDKNITVLSKTTNELKLTTADTVEGDRYMVVTTPDNKVYTNVELNDDGTYKIIVAEPDGNVMVYAKEGRYKVTIYEVTGFNNKDEAKYKTTSAYFNVKNTSAKVTLSKRTKVATEATDIKSLVVDAFEFNLGGNKWDKLTADMITEVKGIDRGSYVVITSVKFNVPLNGSTDNVGYSDSAFAEVKGINLSVQTPEGFDATGLEAK